MHALRKWLLAGLIAAFTGMIFGSLAPQWLPDHKGHVHHFEGTKAAGTA